MSHDPNVSSIDLIRWTFTSDPARRAAIAEHLTDLGLDVLSNDEGKFLVTWDEPDRDLNEVITETWAINGAPFEVIQEQFHRLGLHTLQHVEDEEVEEAA